MEFDALTVDIDSFHHIILLILRQDFLRPFDSSPGLGRGSCSGFRPTGVLKGATSLPVGLHVIVRIAIVTTAPFGAP